MDTQVRSASPAKNDESGSRPAASPQNGSDPELHRKLGRAAAEERHFEEALTHWRRVEELDEADAEAPARIAALITELSRQRLGLATPERDQWLVASGSAGSRAATDLSAPADKSSLDMLLAVSAAANSSGASLKRTPIQELEVAIREFPSNVDYYLQIVPLYLQSGRDYDAERVLAKGREATASDPRVCQLWEDVTMLRLERKLALAQKHDQELDTPETRSELAQILAERDHLEIDIFTSRCRREPDNAGARVELAKRLRRSGKVRDACQRLEEALRTGDERCGAALELGECQMQLGNPREALRYYRLAADSATQPRHLAARKQALYLAGSLAAKLKLRKLAERHLTELLRLDMNFKDAAGVLAGIRKEVAVP
jgi:tetratricopeptide (TPR) repeat protein